MSCSGETVYSSLAQLSVKGQADTLLEQNKVGQLDIFSSAFYTNPSFASGFIRCGDTKQIDATTGGVQIYQPPRSFDVVHDVFLVFELPGLIQVATHTTAGGATRQYEVLPEGRAPRVRYKRAAGVHMVPPGLRVWRPIPIPTPFHCH